MLICSLLIAAGTAALAFAGPIAKQKQKHARAFQYFGVNEAYDAELCDGFLIFCVDNIKSHARRSAWYSNQGDQGSTNFNPFGRAKPRSRAPLKMWRREDLKVTTQLPIWRNAPVWVKVPFSDQHSSQH